jgi:tripartite-type tricarboxylate transporter receptor subunit TctC
MNVNIAVRPARSHGHGKRFWLKALILAAVSSASPGEPLFLRANAQEFPSRRIEIVAPFPAGGSADLFARVVAQKISNSIGHPVIIEPKPGASGIIGTRSVIDAAPDGYTLLSTSVVSLLVPPSLAEPRPFDPLKDVSPITSMAKVPALLVANPNLHVHTFAELIAYATANPGRVNIGSSGTGTLAHLAAELLKREVRIDLFHVPYKGAPPAINDLVAGHVDLMFSDASFFVEHIKAGKLVPLAIATAERIPQLPNVPTTVELGYPGVIADNTYSLFAPGNTPPAIVEKLNTLVRTALADPEVQAFYARQTAIPSGMKTEDFKAFIVSEAARWIPLAKAIVGQQN